MSKWLLRPAASHLLVLVLLLLFATTPCLAMANGETLAPAGLNQQVGDWVSVLSARKPFMEWKHATADIQPLGPGTHSWLVLMQAQGKVVGYLVVLAAADGSYRLGEYGTGPAVLFSDASLKQSLLDNGLITTSSNPSITAHKHYLHPFAAFWEVNVGSDTYWFDAKTAELLPMDNVTLASRSQKTPLPSRSGSGVSASWLKASFDPYESLPWLTGQKPVSVQDAKKVQTWIQGHAHLRYVSEPLGDSLLYALPVVGFQRWTAGRLDLALEMQGTRFIPLDSLRTLGRFYQ